MNMDGKLVQHFNWQPLLSHLKPGDSLQFEDLYDVLAKWAVAPEQTALDYADFARDMPEKGIKDLEDYKKMTDRVV